MSRKVDKALAIIVEENKGNFVTVAEFDDLKEALAALSSLAKEDLRYEIVCNYCGSWTAYRRFLGADVQEIGRLGEAIPALMYEINNVYMHLEALRDRVAFEEREPFTRTLMQLLHLQAECERQMAAKDSEGG